MLFYVDALNHVKRVCGLASNIVNLHFVAYAHLSKPCQISIAED